MGPDVKEQRGPAHNWASHLRHPVIGTARQGAFLGGLPVGPGDCRLSSRLLRPPVPEATRGTFGGLLAKHGAALYGFGCDARTGWAEGGRCQLSSLEAPVIGAAKEGFGPQRGVTRPFRWGGAEHAGSVVQGADSGMS